MRVAAAAAGALIVGVVLLDSFETVILPRGVKRRARLTNLLFALAWRPFRRIARTIHSEARRDTLLAYFGPSRILFLLLAWAIGMILGFSLIHWGLGSHLVQSGARSSFGNDLYFSGSAFFTLGLGDVIPVTGAERALAVLEAGLGLGFLAIVIAYLPVLYQTFSRREVFVNRLEILAGSPPTPGVILRRYARYGPAAVRSLLDEWQNWCAELMDAMKSFPVLAFYRSQHADQSWLTALVAILDTSALMAADPSPEFEDNRDAAELAFSLAVHAARDIAAELPSSARYRSTQRSEGIHHEHIRGWLTHRAGGPEQAAAAADSLQSMCSRYEQYVASMSDGLLIRVPALCPECAPPHHEH